MESSIADSDDLEGHGAYLTIEPHSSILNEQIALTSTLLDGKNFRPSLVYGDGLIDSCKKNIIDIHPGRDSVFMKPSTKRSRKDSLIGNNKRESKENESNLNNNSPFGQVLAEGQHSVSTNLIEFSHHEFSVPRDVQKKSNVSFVMDGELVNLYLVLVGEKLAFYENESEKTTLCIIYVQDIEGITIDKTETGTPIICINLFDNDSKFGFIVDCQESLIKYETFAWADAINMAMNVLHFEEVSYKTEIGGFMCYPTFTDNFYIGVSLEKCLVVQKGKLLAIYNDQQDFERNTPKSLMHLDQTYELTIDENVTSLTLKGNDSETILSSTKKSSLLALCQILKTNIAQITNYSSFAKMLSKLLKISSASWAELEISQNNFVDLNISFLTNNQEIRTERGSIGLIKDKLVIFDCKTGSKLPVEVIPIPRIMYAGFVDIFSKNSLEIFYKSSNLTKQMMLYPCMDDKNALNIHKLITMLQSKFLNSNNDGLYSSFAFIYKSQDVILNVDHSRIILLKKASSAGQSLTKTEIPINKVEIDISFNSFDSNSAEIRFGASFIEKVQLSEIAWRMISNFRLLRIFYEESLPKPAEFDSISPLVIRLCNLFLMKYSRLSHNERLDFLRQSSSARSFADFLTHNTEEMTPAQFSASDIFSGLLLVSNCSAFNVYDLIDFKYIKSDAAKQQFMCRTFNSLPRQHYQHFCLIIVILHRILRYHNFDAKMLHLFSIKLLQTYTKAGNKETASEILPFFSYAVKNANFANFDLNRLFKIGIRTESELNKIKAISLLGQVKTVTQSLKKQFGEFKNIKNPGLFESISIRGSQLTRELDPHQAMLNELTITNDLFGDFIGLSPKNCQYFVAESFYRSRNDPIAPKKDIKVSVQDGNNHFERMRMAINDSEVKLNATDLTDYASSFKIMPDSICYKGISPSFRPPYSSGVSINSRVSNGKYSWIYIDFADTKDLENFLCFFYKHQAKTS